MNDDVMDYVSRTALMLVIVIFVVMAGYIGFGLGYLVASIRSGAP